MAPSLAWLALDRSVWPWDQAWFGAHALALYETLRDDPAGWPAALTRATPWKPPAVAWIGQFFVPLGMAFGNLDAGLRLSTWACHLMALVLLFLALKVLSLDRAWPAAAGTVLVAAAPAFVFLSTQFLAEASQALAVAWFVLVMARAPRWSRSMAAAQIVAATAFAMLAKTTSPLYCALPGVVALFGAFRRRRAASEPSRAGAARASWVLAIVLAAGAAAWYAANFDATLHHATIASFGPVAELYGRREGFLAGAGHWIAAAAGTFFIRPAAWTLAAIVAFGALKALLRPDAGRWGHVDLCAAAALLQIVLAISAFALSANRDPRFAAPLLPLAAVVAAWALRHIAAAWVAAAVIAVLGVQLAAVHTQVLGLWPRRPALLRARLDPALAHVDRDPGPARELAAIVQRTCGRGGFGRYNFVGVDLLHLSGHSLAYASAKERLAGRAGDCRYISLGFQPLVDGQRMVKADEYVYWITVDPDVRPVPPHFEFANRSAPLLFRQLRRRGILQPEPWSGPPGVLLFRFVKR